MTDEEAERLSLVLLQVLGKLDESAAFVQDKGDRAQWDAYRHAVGKVMAGVSLDLLEPLWARFPALRPEYHGGSYAIEPQIYEPRFYRAE